MKKLLAIVVAVMVACMSCLLVACVQKEGVDTTSYDSVKKYIDADGSLNDSSISSLSAVEVSTDKLDSLVGAFNFSNVGDADDLNVDDYNDMMASSQDYYGYSYMDMGYAGVMLYEQYCDVDNGSMFTAVTVEEERAELYTHYTGEDVVDVYQEEDGWYGYSIFDMLDDLDELGSYTYSFVVSEFVLDDTTGEYVSEVTLSMDYDMTGMDLGDGVSNGGMYIGSQSTITARFIDQDTVYLQYHFDSFSATIYYEYNGAVYDQDYSSGMDSVLGEYNVFMIMVFEDQTVTVPDYTMGA